MWTKLWGVVSGVSLKAWGYIGAVFAILFALLKVYDAGKTAATADAQGKTLDDVKARNDVEDRVDNADDAERKRLLHKWTRP